MEENASYAMDQQEDWDSYVKVRHIPGKYGHTNDKVSDIQASYPGWLSTMSGYMGSRCLECEDYWERNPRARENNPRSRHDQKEKADKKNKKQNQRGK